MNADRLRRVIVVDDEEEVIDLMRDILRIHGYGAIATTHWTEAVDALAHEDPDLMLLDLNMPTIDGRALLKFVREQGYDLPVIVVSGFITDDVRTEFRTMGVRAFVDKPFEVGRLTAEIAAVLESVPTADAIADPSDAPVSSDSEPPAAVDSSVPPPVEIPAPTASHDHDPGILAPRPRRQRPASGPPSIPSRRSGSFKRNARILAVLALICIVVAGFMAIASLQETKQAESPEELLRLQ